MLVAARRERAMLYLRSIMHRATPGNEPATPPDVEGPRVDRLGAFRRLRMRQWLPLSPEELFPFFAEARNLESITPDSLGFHVLTPAPIEMGEGTRIEYRLRLRGVPVRWTTLIRDWDPPHHFSDFQLRGPYLCWDHHHRFTAERGGTRCDDEVLFRVPGGPLEALVARLFVVPDVTNIFRHRAQILHDRFAAG